MLSEKMNAALNEQVKWELYSGYLYLSMSAYFANQGLPGASNWMRVQAQEELSHAMKFYDFILERGGAASLKAIDAPPAKWASPLKVFEESLKHERSVTARINNLMDVAMAEKDHATNIFLQWFVTEQIEEESSVGDVINKLKLVGKNGEGLLMIDKELAARVFTPPAA